VQKGKSGKYTVYSRHTGITKTEGQSTIDLDIDSPNEHNSKNSPPPSRSECTLDYIISNIREFRVERQWMEYHTPRNIALALMGELGELAELFQWKGDEGDISSWTDEEVDHIGQELADVSIYLLGMSDICKINMDQFSLKAASRA